MAIPTPALNKPGINPAAQPEVSAWNREGISEPVFNANFAIDPRPLVGAASNSYQWMASDPADSAADRAAHTGLVFIDGSDTAFIDLMSASSPQSVGLVIPTLFGNSPGVGAANGWTIELVMKFDRTAPVPDRAKWSKFVNFGTGGSDWMESFAIAWFGDRPNAGPFTWMIQNYNNFNPVAGQIGENTNLLFQEQPVSGRWYHVVFVVQPKEIPRTTWNATWTVYVDGVQLARLDNAEWPMPVVRDNSYIGASNWGLSDANQRMTVDALRVYDRALSLGQVVAMARLYGNDPQTIPTNQTLAFPATPESTSAASAVTRAPVFNAWFGTNPSTMVRSPTPAAYEWIEIDPTDTPANQAAHKGLIRFNGSASAFIDLNTNFGPNSCGVVLPDIGGAGASGTATAWTFEFVFKIGVKTPWSKLFNFGNGPELATILAGVDGTDSTTMNFELFDREQTTWPHGFAELMTPDLNTWYHVVAIVSRDEQNGALGAGNWQFWLNGQLMNRAELLKSGSSFAAVQGANYPKYVHRMNSYIAKSNWNDPTFIGVMDAFRIYDYALTQQQITTLATQYNCLTPSMAIPTPALNKNVNPSDQAEVTTWNREGNNIPAPVFNGNFAVDPRPLVGAASSAYEWMQFDPTDSSNDQTYHRGLIRINGSDSSYVDLMSASSPQSVGLVLPTLFGNSPAVGSANGWTIELVAKFDRPTPLPDRSKWSKLINFGTGGSDWMESFALSWFGDRPNAGPYSLMVQNYNNFNPVVGQIIENTNMQFLEQPQLKRWYHIALVIQPNEIPRTTWNATWTMYIDGSVAARLANAEWPMPVVRDNSYIGASNWGLSDANQMMTVDALRMYDQALTSSQINTLSRIYNGTAASWVPAGSSSSSSLSGGAIAGIVIGTLVGAAILLAIVVCFCLGGSRKGKSTKNMGDDSLPRNNTGYGEMEHSEVNPSEHHTDEEIEMGESHT